MGAAANQRGELDMMLAAVRVATRCRYMDERHSGRWGELRAATPMPVVRVQLGC